MEGICNCGGRIRCSEHTVTTTEGASKWVGDECSLPISVEQSACTSCGRQMTVVRDAMKKIIAKKG